MRYVRTAHRAAPYAISVPQLDRTAPCAISVPQIAYSTWCRVLPADLLHVPGSSIAHVSTGHGVGNA
eukprot:1240714-Rhodomonas_salina.3